MRLLFVATVGCLFVLPFYVLWFLSPPLNISLALGIWVSLLIFFYIFFDDDGRFHV